MNLIPITVISVVCLDIGEYGDMAQAPKEKRILQANSNPEKLMREIVEMTICGSRRSWPEGLRLLVNDSSVVEIREGK